MLEQLVVDSLKQNHPEWGDFFVGLIVCTVEVQIDIADNRWATKDTPIGIGDKTINE